MASAIWSREWRAAAVYGPYGIRSQYRFTLAGAPAYLAASIRRIVAVLGKKLRLAPSRNLLKTIGDEKNNHPQVH